MPVSIANVSLTNTFDQWRIITNQLSTAMGQTIQFVSNNSVIQVTPQAGITDTVFISSNAFPNTGGTITGNVTIAQNFQANGNVTLQNTVTFAANTIMYANGALSSTNNNQVQNVAVITIGGATIWSNGMIVMI